MVAGAICIAIVLGLGSPSPLAAPLDGAPAAECPALRQESPGRISDAKLDDPAHPPAPRRQPNGRESSPPSVQIARIECREAIPALVSSPILFGGGAVPSPLHLRR